MTLSLLRPVSRVRRLGSRLASATLVVLLLATGASAQVVGGIESVGVQISGVPPVAVSPFVNDLLEFAESGATTTTVSVLGASAEVAFRVTIEYEGLVVGDVLGLPVTLEPGIYTYQTFDESPSLGLSGSLAEDLLDALDSTLREQVVRTGALPEGDYTIRLAPEGPFVVGTEGVATTRVVYPEPPLLLAPADDGAVLSPVVTLSWAPVTGAAGRPVSYAVTLVEVLPGQRAVEAIESNPAVARVEDLVGTSWTATPDRARLETGRTYAWTVEATVAGTQGPLPLRNDGRTDVWSFTVQKSSYAPPQLFRPARDQAVTPSDRFLWRAAAGPYEPSLTQGVVVAEILDGESPDDALRRATRSGDAALSVAATWTPGGITSVTLEELIQSDPEARPLRLGARFAWGVILERTDGGPPLVQSRARSFTTRPAAPPTPPELAFPEPLQILAQRTLRERGFRWRASDGPDGAEQRLLVWRVVPGAQFSSDVLRQTPVLNQAVAFEPDREATWVWAEGEDLAEGAYVWLVRTVAAGGDGTDEWLSESEPGLFEIQLPVVVDADGCRGGGPGDASAPRDAASVVGETVCIGDFALVVTEVEEASGSGTGVLGGLPFVQAPIRVRFNGLAVDTNGRAFEGRAEALPDPSAALDDLATDFAGDLTSASALRLRDAMSLARQTGRLASALTSDVPAGLPIGIDQPGAVLVVAGIEVTPEGGRLNALADLPLGALPGPFGQVAVGARGVAFDADGFTGAVTLELIRDELFPAEPAPGDLVHGLIATTGDREGTLAVWTDDGFDRIHVVYEQQYPRDWLIPVDGEDNRQSGRAAARFEADVTDDGDWFAEGTLGAAEVAQADGFVLRGAAVTLDGSSTRDPRGIRLPDGAPTGGGWTGVFASSLALAFPETFADTDGTRPQAEIASLTIDGTGVAFDARADSLLTEDRSGRIGGWALTLDRAEVSVRRSELEEATLVGGIGVPLFDRLVPYDATLVRRDGALAADFRLRASGEYRIPGWGAVVRLYDGSHVGVTLDGSGFGARAELHGSLDLNLAPDGEPPVVVRGIPFQNLVLETDADGDTTVPDGGTPFTGSREGLLAGLPVRLRDVHLVTRTDEGALGLGLAGTVALALDADWVEGETTMTVWGRLNVIDSRFSSLTTFDYSEIEVNAIEVAGDLAGALAIEGRLDLFDADPVWGDGMSGTVSATLLDGTGIEALARFGQAPERDGGFDYWSVDLTAQFPVPVPLFPSVGLFGIGGGASEGVAFAIPEDPDQAPTYRPDRRSALALRARTRIGLLPEPATFNADATLGIAFGDHGSLKSVTLEGDGYVMAGFADRGDAPITADLDMAYDVEQNILHASLGANVRTAGDVVTGSGDAVFHAESGRTFFRLGAPDDMAQLSYGIPGVGDITSYTYFHVGDDAPATLPPLPPGAPRLSGQDLRGNGSATPESQGSIVGQRASASAAATGGAGFAMGMRTLVDFDKEVGIFYGVVDAGLGFDASVVQRTQGCGSIPPSAVGLNGWYATGQMFAYLRVALGVQVDVWFAEGRYDLFDLYAGLAMRGGGPNPTWAQGRADFRYRLLGGAVKGRGSYRVEVGEECSPAAVEVDPLAGLTVIGDLAPGDGARRVDPFAIPAAAFNLDVDQPFTLFDPATEETKTFRVEVRQAVLSTGSGGMATTVEVARDGSSATFTPVGTLRPETRYTLRLQVGASERRGGTWRRRSETETREVRFTTGPLPDVIRPGDIAYTVPYDRQRYALVGDIETARLVYTGPNSSRRLYSHLGQLDNPDANDTVALEAYFVGPDGEALRSDLSFRRGQITFPLPDGLQPETLYRVVLVRSEFNAAQVRLERNLRIGRDLTPTFAIPGQPGAVAGLVFDESYGGLRVAGEGTTAEVRRRTIASFGSGPNTRVLYDFAFRTSRHERLQDKLDGATLAFDARQPDRSYLLRLDGLDEPFDRADLFGDGGPVPLVGFTGRYGTDWHSDWLHPEITSQRSALCRNGVRAECSTATSRVFALDRAHNDREDARILGLAPRRVSASDITQGPPPSGIGRANIPRGSVASGLPPRLSDGEVASGIAQTYGVRSVRLVWYEEALARESWSGLWAGIFDLFGRNRRQQALALSQGAGWQPPGADDYPLGYWRPYWQTRSNGVTLSRSSSGQSQQIYVPITQ